MALMMLFNHIINSYKYSCGRICKTWGSRYKEDI